MKANPNWEMERVIPLATKNKTGPTASAVTSLSADTLVRHYPQLIRRVSPGRIGMRMRDALGIADGTVTPSSGNAA